MKRLVAILVGTLVAMLFAVANSHHVEVSFIFGAPVRMRMIFLMAGVFISGVLTTVIFQGYQVAKRQREAAERKKRPANDDHDDLFGTDN